MKIMRWIVFPIVLIPVGLWVSGRPSKHSLAHEAQGEFVEWRLNGEQQLKIDPFSDIRFDLPKGFKVLVNREADFVMYEIFEPNEKKILSLYFGAHPDWPPTVHWLDARYEKPKEKLTLKAVSRFSLCSNSKELLLYGSESGWSVLGRYSRLSRGNAAVADRIIESIQIPSRINS